MSTNRFSDFLSSENPFQTPTGNGRVAAAANDSRGYPRFPLVMFTLAIVFCCIRGLLVFLGIVGLSMIDPKDPVYQLGVAEVITGAIMAGCGLLGYGLMLARRSSGVALAWISLAAVVVNILVGVLQVPNMPVFRGTGPGFVIAIIGVAIVVVIRLGLVIGMGMAILQFRTWLHEGVGP